MYWRERSFFTTVSLRLEDTETRFSNTEALLLKQIWWFLMRTQKHKTQKFFPSSFLDQWGLCLNNTNICLKTSCKKCTWYKLQNKYLSCTKEGMCLYHIEPNRAPKRAPVNVCLRHSLKLNADLADTPLQKSLWQFCKYCWPNLNYGKIYIFKSNTVSMLKLTFFGNKLENAFSRP